MTLQSALPWAVFIGCCALVTFARRESGWPLFGFLVIGHVNLSDPGSSSGFSIHWVNAIRIVVVPLVLWLRTGPMASGFLWRQPVFLLWVLLVAIAGTAVIWSPFPAAGVKNLGFMGAHSVAALAVFVWFRYYRRAAARAVAWSLVAALAIALLQTIVLGNEWGGPFHRFTSWSAPQGFALALPVMLAVILLMMSERRGQSMIAALPLMFVTLGVVAINSSRAGLAAAILICATAALGLLYPLDFRKLLAASTTALLGTLAMWLVLWLPSDRPQSTPASPIAGRYVETIELLRGDRRLTEVGTASFREDMYTTLWQSIRRRGAPQLLIGSGTGSVGTVVASGLLSYRSYDVVTVDPNRLAHNEFLRALYEWGTIGLGVLVMGLGYLLMVTFYRTVIHPDFRHLLALACLTTGVLYLAVENIFAAAMAPSGQALLVALAAFSTGRSGPPDCVAGPRNPQRSSNELSSATTLDSP